MKHDPKDTKKIEQLRTEFEQLDQLGETPGVAVAQHRGHRFEGLLLDLLNSHGLLLRTSFHTADNRREQIDGAIRIDSRIALIEAKWTKQDVTASELYAFLGKIEGKFVGTIGLFVSRTELSENFITSLRSGRRQSTLIIHGDDVPHIFTPEFPLEEYLTACIARVSIDNVAHLPAAQFLAEREEQKQAKQTSDDARKLLEPLYESLRRPDTATLIPLLTKEKKPDELEQEITLLLRVLPKILLQATENNPARRNIPAYIASGAQRLPSSPTPVDRQFFSTLDAAIQRDEYHPIIDAFSKRLNLLPPELTRPANQAIQDAWLKAATFEDENRLVGPTRSLWPSHSAYDL